MPPMFLPELVLSDRNTGLATGFADYTAPLLSIPMANSPTLTIMEGADSLPLWE